MSKFYQIKTLDGSLAYVNRELVADIYVPIKHIQVPNPDNPQLKTVFSVVYSYSGYNEHAESGGISSAHETFEEACKEAKMIACGHDQVIE